MSSYLIVSIELTLLSFLLIQNFPDLYNQLISIYCIVTYSGVQMFEECDQIDTNKWLLLSAFHQSLWGNLNWFLS